MSILHSWPAFIQCLLHAEVCTYPTVGGGWMGQEAKVPEMPVPEVCSPDGDHAYTQNTATFPE